MAQPVSLAKMPTTPATYPFQCAVHGAAMSGTVIVW
jgi:plastocyanin